MSRPAIDPMNLVVARYGYVNEDGSTTTRTVYEGHVIDLANALTALSEHELDHTEVTVYACDFDADERTFLFAEELRVIPAERFVR